MKNMFNSSKGKGNGVNTTNRCMGCTKRLRSCIFKDVAGQFNKAAEEGGPVMSEQQKDVDQQHELNEGESIFPDLDNLTPEELEVIKRDSTNYSTQMRKTRKKRKKKRRPPSCANLISSPSKQSITNIMAARIISFFV